MRPAGLHWTAKVHKWRPSVTAIAEGVGIQPLPVDRQTELVRLGDQTYAVGMEVPCTRLSATVLRLTGQLVIARQITPDGSPATMRRPALFGEYPVAPPTPDLYGDPEALERHAEQMRTYAQAVEARRAKAQQGPDIIPRPAYIGRVCLAGSTSLHLRQPRQQKADETISPAMCTSHVVTYRGISRVAEYQLRLLHRQR